VTVDPLTVLREALDVLYNYTSDNANPPGEGRSWWRSEGIAALAAVEQLVEAARAVIANQILVRYDNAADPMFDLSAALARFEGDSQQGTAA